MGERWLRSGGAFKVLGLRGSSGGVEDNGGRDEAARRIGRTTGPDRVASGSFGTDNKNGS
ncbi:hypothetical protein ACHAWO_008061 [Cyclotella atomus]|jgi:hypothetical protein|uniref:Uncharacterized protein n=1 Tax=Cyclotella atomus TaxID=382360 RepID=A0ABD3MSG3_9STRA